MSDQSDEAEEGSKRLSLAEKFKLHGATFIPPSAGSPHGSLA